MTLRGIINKSFDKGLFPKQLKKAKVNTIFNNSDSTLLKSYRPICLNQFTSLNFQNL